MNDSSKNTTPKVTVCVVTYNQEKYIAQCLQSIVDQVTDFDFDVIVSDDCSTDETRKIIREFSDKYPNIKPILRDKNIGALENFKQTHLLAKAEFVCHCDGDDYWLPGKLQIQADYLSNNHSCNIVWTRMNIRNESENLELSDLISPKVVSTKFYRGDIIQFIAIGLHSSKMYRNRAVAEPSFPIVDYFANVEQVSDGYACFVGEGCYGVYRAGIGIASDGNTTKLIIAKCINYFKTSHPSFSNRANACLYLLILIELKNYRWKNAIVFAKELGFKGSLMGGYYFFKKLPMVKYFQLPKLS